MSASPPEALVVGEALIDLIRRPDRPPVSSVGGSPLNVAVGLSRLDVPVLLHSHIGDDEHADLITDHLDENEVRLTPSSITAGPTSTAVATIGSDGAATYDFDIRWAVGEAPSGTPALVHTGSIASVLEPGAGPVRDLLDALRPCATISYDPNVRPRLMGDRGAARDNVESLVRRADVVKASDEDVQWLFPGCAPTAVARRWSGMGPALVVVTSGAGGAYAVGSTGTSVDVPALPTRVVDTIGAGDSFMAGLLAALSDAGVLGRDRAWALHSLTEEAIAELVGFAARCAAVTVSRPGADPPRREALASP
ncbi:carbohydrate kinase [Nocardioides maradonensis]